MTIKKKVYDISDFGPTFINAIAVSGNEKNFPETKEPCHFRCINCGRGASDLFKDYNNGIIKMKHCVINIFFF